MFQQKREDDDDEKSEEFFTCRSLSFEFRVSFYSFDTLNSCVSFFVFFFPFLYHLFLTTLTQKNVHKEEEEPKH